MCRFLGLTRQPTKLNWQTSEQSIVINKVNGSWGTGDYWSSDLHINMYVLSQTWIYPQICMYRCIHTIFIFCLAAVLVWLNQAFKYVCLSSSNTTTGNVVLLLFFFSLYGSKIFLPDLWQLFFHQRQAFTRYTSSGVFWPSVNFLTFKFLN